MNRSRRVVVPIVVLVLVSLPMLEASGMAEQRHPAVSATLEPVASVPDWQNLPYLRQTNGWFRIISSHETFGGVAIHPTATITPNNPDPTGEEYQGIRLEALWANRCKAVDQQKVKLSRKVYFPGDPATLQVSQWAYSSSGKHPLKSIAVKVNGSVVHQAFGSAIETSVNRTFIDLPHSAGSSFVYGENTISLVAVKRETKRRAGYCSSKKFGAAFELAGTFRADVSSDIPPGTGTDSSAYMPMTITNNGPSHLPAGTYPCQVPSTGGQTEPGSCGYPTMSYFALSETATITDVIAFDGPLGSTTIRPDCRKYSNISGNRRGYTLNCSVPALAPGESVTIGIGLTYETADPNTLKIYFGYAAPGYAETIETNANNGENDRELVGPQ